MKETKLNNWGLNVKDLHHWLENDLKANQDTLLSAANKDLIKKRLQTFISTHQEQIPPAIKLMLTLNTSQLPSPPTSLVELAPICTKRKSSEPLDVVLKRQRNTDSARRSRQRKAMRVEALENRIQELTTENNALNVKVAVLESKIGHISEREQRNKQRVLELEAQLAAVHQRLLSNV
ncbi:hypothetical protein G6F56_009153 [Rhizopus delemar]|uniref:BZIP domain-containing protein n=1 Tax=Rhizopus stolonifer TaxID=4846 RepID=A0A367JVJ9_RHIST|nr:hypothetical protein G6F56_009153 [Rhizopus delemar]RCH93928.1 hypothetical protein CU098_009031 [Rhizopus stolonifer]